MAKKDTETAGRGDAETPETELEETPDMPETELEETPDMPVDVSKAKRVRVISEGTLGPKLLTNGDVTDDPDYVAILQQKGQKKVEAVK